MWKLQTRQTLHQRLSRSLEVVQLVFIVCSCMGSLREVRRILVAEDPVGVSKQTVSAALDIETRSSSERQMHSSGPREKNSRGNDRRNQGEVERGISSSQPLVSFSIESRFFAF